MMISAVVVAPSALGVAHAATCDSTGGYNGIDRPYVSTWASGMPYIPANCRTATAFKYSGAWYNSNNWKAPTVLSIWTWQIYTWNTIDANGWYTKQV